VSKPNTTPKEYIPIKDVNVLNEDKVRLDLTLALIAAGRDSIRIANEVEILMNYIHRKKT